MFGYIRPLKDEMKVREYDQFKACYCALCHALKTEYGSLASLVLNYDVTFLAMLLWDDNDPISTTCARCAASPLKKKEYCLPTKSLSMCAGYNVILAWWKLQDSIKDERFINTLLDRALTLLIRRAYKKASKKHASFDALVKTNISELDKLEAAHKSSLDACADKFALITAGLAGETPDKTKFRPMEQLLYHIGRYIYIIDACDDLEKDLKVRSFNPVAERFGLTEGKLSADATQALKATLIHSISMISAAYELMKPNVWSPITNNIIYLGMPEVCNRVLNGTWHNEKKPN